MKRYALTMFTVVLLLLSACPARAQKPLSDVIRAIAARPGDYHVHCIYDQLDSIFVTDKVQNLSVPDAIAKVTKGQPVKVKQKGHDIFIQYSSRKALQRINLHGTVLDQRTHKHLVGATVQLLRRDSTVVATEVAHAVQIFDGAFDAQGNHVGGKEEHTAEFTLQIPKAQEQYILAVSYVGYQTAYVDYAVSNLRKREVTRELPPICLKQESHVLKNVDVVASKVMFYHRGDTIVFNADAFQLAEGSMLDALVRQLPGVELRANGQIYHNGKFVDNLLLNGKDFFRGHQEVMLDNLPSYTVKEIKVYDKYGEKSEFLGTRLADDKEYVMDVRLKREYSIGWIGNTEAGSGTAGRYLARLLAIRFTDHSRLAVYANANNLNDKRKPGENDDWTPSDMNEGRLAQRMAGLDYNLEERDKRWKAEGNVQLSHNDLDASSTTDQTNFLRTGDTRERMEQSRRQKNFTIDTRHKLRTKFSKFDLVLSPKLTYQRYDHSHLLDAVTRSVAGDTLINTLLQQGKTKGHELKADVSISSTVKLGSSDESMSIEVMTSYSDKDDDRFSRYHIGYANTQPPSPNTQHSSPITQYLPNHPDRQWTVHPTIIYERQLSTKFTLQPIYLYTHQEQQRRQSLYQLDLLPSSLGLQPFGLPADEVELAQTLDRTNSFDSHQWVNKHEVRPTMFWFPKLLGSEASVGIHPSGVFLHQRLCYRRGDMDTTLTRRDTYFSVPMFYLVWLSKNEKFNVNLNYQYSVKTPELADLVSIHDTTDPMNIYEGAPSLRNRHTQNASFSVSHRLRQRQLSQTLYGSYTHHDGAVVKGYDYDYATGVRTWRPYNVNGNWNGSLKYSLTLPLDKPRRLMLTTATEGTCQHSVRMAGGQRQAIDNRTLEEQLRLTWKLGDNRLTWKTNALMRHVGSSQPGFEDFRACDVTIGASALIRLPLKMQLSTDFTAYTRHGYTAQELNTTDLVWNARLTCPLMRGRLLIALDGFDILGQLSNVTRTINAQSHAETYTNTLPRYALLHLAWRFNKQPKKEECLERSEKRREGVNCKP